MDNYVTFDIRPRFVRRQLPKNSSSLLLTHGPAGILETKRGSYYLSPFG